MVQSCDFWHSMTSMTSRPRPNSHHRVNPTELYKRHFVPCISCGSKVTNTIFQILQVGPHIWHKNWHNRCFPDRESGTIWNLLVISNRVFKYRKRFVTFVPQLAKKPKTGLKKPIYVIMTSHTPYRRRTTAINFPTTASIFPPTYHRFWDFQEKPDLSPAQGTGFSPITPWRRRPPVPSHISEVGPFSLINYSFWILQIARLKIKLSKKHRFSNFRHDHIYRYLTRIRVISHIYKEELKTTKTTYPPD